VCRWFVGIVETLVKLIIVSVMEAIAGSGRLDRFDHVADCGHAVFRSVHLVVNFFLVTFLSEESVKTFLEKLRIGTITIFLHHYRRRIYWLTMSRVRSVSGIGRCGMSKFVEARETIGASPARIVVPTHRAQ